MAEKNIIDKSIFEGEIKIPNKHKPEVSERLDIFIDEKEDEILDDVLGYGLSKEFKAGIVDYDEEDSSLIADKWWNLIEGVEWTKNSKLRKFKGLKMIIANYVYWHWMTDKITQSIALGEAAATAENADIVSPASKMVRAWNEMSEDIHELYHYLQENKDTYPEWDSHYSKSRMLKRFGRSNTWGF